MATADARAQATAELRRAVGLAEAVADSVAPHHRSDASWSPEHGAIVTGRVEGRFRLGVRVEDLTVLIIDRQDKVMTRCALEGVPGFAAGQTLLRGIQGHFGLHGHTLSKTPKVTFSRAPVALALGMGATVEELATAALELS